MRSDRAAFVSVSAISDPVGPGLSLHGGALVNRTTRPNLGFQTSRGETKGVGQGARRQLPGILDVDYLKKEIPFSTMLTAVIVADHTGLNATGLSP
jgi:hypothetical protein